MASTRCSTRLRAWRRTLSQPSAGRGPGIEVRPKVAAVGSRTADRLRSRGVDVAVVPDEFTAEALVRTLTSQATVRGARVLLPRSEIGRDVIAEGLRAAGAIVTDVIAYRTVAEAGERGRGRS